MSSDIIRKGWKQATGPPSWCFKHESGWEVRASENLEDRRPYWLFAPDGKPCNISPYNRGFYKRCQAMAMAEFFARNPFIYESLQNHAKPILRCNVNQSDQSPGADPLAVHRGG